ncbi:hypothetical protein ACFVWZ_31070 [Streptomyces sp. NPDC058200]|uniref:hypothetical protein n=1 Tax=Streptomyces sp. NPDC058200 TaxID=3346378 RepID=UPI0036E3E37E
MTIVEAVTDRWGVILRADSKVVWCELATNLRSQTDHVEGPQVAKAEALLTVYCLGGTFKAYPHERLSVAVAEEAVIDMIADLLHWLRAHGRDPDEILDRAQMHFEAELEEAG